MVFLQSAMLWALLAAGIPVLIHLLNRRRHRTVKWAAMQFLLKATRESRGRKRLRHILILTCRVLGIAALATAAARPLVSGLLGWGSGHPDLVILVLDRSASMEANPAGGAIPRREIGLRRVTDALADLAGTRVVLLDSAGGQPQDLPSPGALIELSATAATDTSASLTQLLSRSAEFLSQVPENSEIWIVSDLQASSWEPAHERWEAVRASLGSLPRPPRLRVLSLAGDSAPNLSVRILESRRLGSRLALDLEFNRNPDAGGSVQVPLEIELNGARRSESVTVSGQRLTSRHLIPIPRQEESGHGSVRIPGDGNPRDNVAYFAYGPPRPVRSLVVAPEGEAADYLALAAAPGNFGGSEVELIQEPGPESLDLDGIACLLWALPLPDGALADRLEDFLEDGGRILFFAPLKDDETSFLELSWSPLEESPAEQFFVLDSWNHDDGLLRDGLDGSAIPADRLKSIRRRLPRGNSPVFARWNDSEPFLSRLVVGRGVAWMVGSRPDYTWSNLGDADVLLPLVQRAVTAGSQRFDAGYLAELGSNLARVRPGESHRRLDDHDPASGAESIHLAGIHQLGDRTLALNRPASEDLPDRIDAATLDTLLEGTRFSLFEDAGASASESISRGVWRGFLIAMLCFLVAEALLCLPTAAPERATATTPARPFHAR